MTADDEATLRDFKAAVNMAAGELEAWLETDAAKRVGSKKGTESVGHRSGRRIVKLLGKTKDDFTASDFRHMGKVVGYVRRHLAQRPEGDTTETNWRYSLMNWGHDPTK